MKARSVYLDRERLRLDSTMIIGTGGEADVFDLGDGRALKVFKGPDHPDLDGMPAEQHAARERLDIHQRKLADFPASLPERVVAPRALARTRKRGGRIVGYAMQRVAAAELLYRYGEPRFRRTRGAGEVVVDILGDLHDTVTQVHAAGVVIGDFNDLNVLVSGRRAYLIDADSFQYGGYTCAVYSERFVDPLLCNANASALVLANRHNHESDWYAFAVMVMRSLLGVGPYGGVYRPRDPAKRITHALRPLRRITVFDADVVYPRPALHYKVLPDDLVDYLHTVFMHDGRGAFPARLLDGLRWTRCTQCGAEHARGQCPQCSTGKNQVVTTRVRGRVRADERFATSGDIAAAAMHKGELRWLHWNDAGLANRHGQILMPASVSDQARISAAHNHLVCNDDGAYLVEHGHVRALGPVGAGEDAVRVIDACAGNAGDRAAFASNARHSYWLQGGRLLRSGPWAPVVMGNVLRGQTRIWVGERFGVGFYRAGALTIGFVFDAERPGIDDSVALPRIRGAIIDAHCVIGHERAWLWWMEKRSARTVPRCVVLDARGRILARADESSATLCATPGACAVAGFLFVPTDQGMVRLETHQGGVHPTRKFPDTAPFMDAATRLMAGAKGFYAVSRQRITHLTIT